MLGLLDNRPLVAILLRFENITGYLLRFAAFARFSLLRKDAECSADVNGLQKNISATIRDAGSPGIGRECAARCTANQFSRHSERL